MRKRRAAGPESTLTNPSSARASACSSGSLRAASGRTLRQGSVGRRVGAVGRPELVGGLTQQPGDQLVVAIRPRIGRTGRERMKDALQLVEDVAAEAGGQRVAVDDGADQRRLGLENGLDEVVDGVPRHEIRDVDSARLADPVRPVLGLPVIRRHPVEIVEHDLRGCGQVESRAARDDVRDEDADLGVALEAVDERLARGGRRLSGHDDGRGAELSGDLLNRAVEARKHDDLLALVDRAPDEVERGGRLCQRERLPCLHQEGEELAATAQLDVPRRRRP